MPDMDGVEPHDRNLHNMRGDVEYLDDPPTAGIQTTGCGKRLLTRTILHPDGPAIITGYCPVCFEPELGPVDVETRIIEGRN